MYEALIYVWIRFISIWDKHRTKITCHSEISIIIVTIVSSWFISAFFFWLFKFLVTSLILHIRNYTKKSIFLELLNVYYTTFRRRGVWYRTRYDLGKRAMRKKRWFATKSFNVHASAKTAVDNWKSFHFFAFANSHLGMRPVTVCMPTRSIEVCTANRVVTQQETVQWTSSCSNRDT